MWLVIWKNKLGTIFTNAFENKCDSEDFADNVENSSNKVLYVLYDARA